MAFKTLQANGQAKKIEEAKKIEGFLVSVDHKTKKEKVRGGGMQTRHSYIYSIETKTGRIQLWGCADIDNNLLSGHELNPEYIGVMARLTFKGRVAIKGREEKKKQVLVEVDPSNRMKLGGVKDYILEPSKKMKQ